MRRVVSPWLAVAWFGFAALPWNAIGGGGFFAFDWIAQYPFGLASAPALVQLLWYRRFGLLPLFVLLLVALALLRAPADAAARRRRALPVAVVGGGLLVGLAAIALAID